jgi:hypothetical protein
MELRKRMGREFYNEKGQEVYMNISTWQFINNISIGLFEKIGVIWPINQKDCKLIARIMKNIIHYNKIGFPSYYKDKIPTLNKQEIKYLETEILPFFENSKWIKEDR